MERCRTNTPISWSRIATLLAFLLLWLPAFAQQDQVVPSGTSPYTIIGRNLNWGVGGVGNIQNNFIFHPISPDEGLCVYITNNNPTNAHTFTMLVAQTGDQSLNAYSGVSGQWSTVPTSTTFPFSVSALGTVGITYKTTASAGIMVQITNTSSLPGNPDTASVFAVQTVSSTCGSFLAVPVQGVVTQGTALAPQQQFPLLIGGLSGSNIPTMMQIGGSGGLELEGGNCCVGAGMGQGGFEQPANFAEVLMTHASRTNSFGMMNTVSIGTFGLKGTIGGSVKTNFLESGSDMQIFPTTSMVSFTVQRSTTTPGAGATLLHSFNLANSLVNPAYKAAVISCGSTTPATGCEVIVNRTTAQGGTCTALTPISTNIFTGSRASPNASDIAEATCTTPPTVGNVLYDLFIGSGQTYSLDLSGFVNHNASTGAGIDFINNIAVTAGAASVTLTWVEE